jgi:hypothetical protein
MGVRIDRVKDELLDFWAETVHQNGPRWKNPRERHHLYVDFWVSLFSMSYTLGHVAAVAIPVAVILAL